MLHLRLQSSGTSVRVVLWTRRAAESSDANRFANLRLSHETPTGGVDVGCYVAFWKDDL